MIIAAAIALIAATLGLALPASAASPITATTTTTVASSPNAGVGVAGVLLYASVAPNTAGGTVAFTDGTTGIRGCAARPVNADSASFGYSSCITTFTSPGPHIIAATYAGDATHSGSTGATTLTVTATPDFLQIVIGLINNFAQALHLFGLNPIDSGPTPPATTTVPPVTTTTPPPTTTTAAPVTTTPPPTTTTTTVPPYTPPAPPTSTAPVFTGDFPDPSVVLDGSTYYAFATQGDGAAVQRLTSPDRVQWVKTALPDALFDVPSWADRLGTWAPEVQRVGARYLMYYTVQRGKDGAECISVASADSPALQFVDNSAAPLVCQVPGGGSIDPSPFIAPNGARFLNWKSNVDGAATLLTRQMTPDGLSFAAAAQTPLLQSSAVAWAPSNIEAPSMVFSGGKYYLFYSGNVYTSLTYGIGYAVCATPLGPRAPTSAPRLPGWAPTATRRVLAVRASSPTKPVPW